jgi:hypothetical protein
MWGQQAVTPLLLPALLLLQQVGLAYGHEGFGGRGFLLLLLLGTQHHPLLLLLLQVGSVCEHVYSAEQRQMGSL